MLALYGRRELLRVLWTSADLLCKSLAMTISLLVRRHQASQATNAGNASSRHGRSESVIDQSRQKHLLAEVNAITKRNRSLLRLTAVLNDCVPASNQHLALNILLSQPQMLESLRRAVEGDYDMILNLLSCLDSGSANKELVDAAIDQCEPV